MVRQLRIARLDASGFVPTLGDGAASADLHQRLDALIRRHLPEVTASLFAEPAPAADGRMIEWYSDLAGQPVPLTALTSQAYAKARDVLNERLKSLAALADRLPRIDPSAADLAGPLRQALTYPGEESVYVIGGQPVIVFWGHQRQGAVPPPGPVSSAAAAEPVAEGAAVVPPATVAAATTAAGPRRLWPLGLLALLALVGLAGYGLVAFDLMRWPPWGPDYQALLRTAKDEEQALRSRMAELEANMRDALALCALQARLAAARADEEPLRQQVDALNAQLAADRELCPLKEQLRAARDEGAALTRSLDSVQSKLAKAIAACKRKAELARKKERDEQRRAEAERREAERAARQAEEEAKRQAAKPPVDQPRTPSAAKGLPPCPGERPPEEAPDVAIVLDSSGSMGFPASMTNTDVRSEIARQIMQGVFGPAAGMVMPRQSGPSRLEEAKKGINNVVRSLPQDVDAGLVVLKRCPMADNLGFFSPSQRGALTRQVDSLRPMQGTPLAQGIAQAGAMVDGVKAPGVIVVISDGEDSCGGDPCQAARALKAAKPKVTINVVDIVGSNAARCVAQVTGGQILTPEDGLAFEKTIRKATTEALKPPHCP
ncbi:MAG TPA: VWA domain-containing protein [Defluviicoccus sp.]|nr:VWA domain-containing protein [Defluviicoccus sp.]